MKICYKTCEKLKLSKMGNLKRCNCIYIEMDSCAVCGESYLMPKHQPTDICSISCGLIRSRNGEKHPLFGKRQSNKTRKLMSLKRKGKDNPNWRGGTTKIGQLIRSSSKYITWRNSVFTRDGYKCVLCKTNCYIHAHHKIPLHNLLETYNIKCIDTAFNCDIIWGVKNGITLCEDCHNFYHRRNF